LYIRLCGAIRVANAQACHRAARFRRVARDVRRVRSKICRCGADNIWFSDAVGVANAAVMYETGIDFNLFYRVDVRALIASGCHAQILRPVVASHDLKSTVCYLVVLSAGNALRQSGLLNACFDVFTTASKLHHPCAVII
jgi:hypothetical protein